MATPNYHYARKQKEQARKVRQQEKQARRARRSGAQEQPKGDPAPAPETPEVSAALSTGNRP